MDNEDLICKLSNSRYDLAVFLGEHIDCSRCPAKPYCESPGREDCINAIRTWLGASCRPFEWDELIVIPPRFPVFFSLETKENDGLICYVDYDYKSDKISLWKNYNEKGGKALYTFQKEEYYSSKFKIYHI